MNTLLVEKIISGGTAILSLIIIFVSLKYFRRVDQPANWPKLLYSVSGSIMFAISILNVFEQSSLLVYEIVSMLVCVNVLSSLLASVTQMTLERTLEEFILREQLKVKNEEKDNGCR